MGLTWRPLRRSSTGLIPLGYPNQTDVCWARSSRGLAPWTCRTRGNLFTCASKICRLEATLGMDSSNVHFFQDCHKCVQVFTKQRVLFLETVNQRLSKH